MGNELTWSGIGMVGVSGIGAFFAPEAFPAEAGGMEFGASIIELGADVSYVGSAAEGYASNGVAGSALAVTTEFLTDQISARSTGALFKGINEGTKSAVSSLLSKIPDAMKAEEAACGGS